MVRNNLRVCYMGNVVKLFMKERVWHPLCCQWAAHQFSSSLSHLWHLIFIPIKPPFHISFLSLSCLSLLLLFLFVFPNVSYSFYILPLISLPVISFLLHTTSCCHQVLFSSFLLFSTSISHFAQCYKNNRIPANSQLKLLFSTFSTLKSENLRKWWLTLLVGSFLAPPQHLRNWQSGDRYMYMLLADWIKDKYRRVGERWGRAQRKETSDKQRCKNREWKWEKEEVTLHYNKVSRKKDRQQWETGKTVDK